MTRLAGGRGHSGLLSVEELAALSSVGFEQCSEVIGAVAYDPPPTQFYTSGLSPVPDSGFSRKRLSASYQTYTSSRNTAAVGTPGHITALRGGYRTALQRLVEETKVIGGDGAVGVTVTCEETRLGESEVWSFLAIGTAIRSTGRARAASPFTTALSGTATATALRAGWVPITFLACPVMAIRAVDSESSPRLRRRAANGEVDAHTDAVNTCRHQARTDFAAAARAVRADAAVMGSMTMSHGRSHGPVRITVVITGTALARFGRRSEASPLSVLALDGRLR